jgi:hypothetical protein
MIIKIVRSGGQTGADIAGVQAAYDFGIPTKGMMPRGFLTELGFKPAWGEKYNLSEHTSDKYPPRTYENVKMATGTIRFAKNFETRGEKLTLTAINQYNRPYKDVDIFNPLPVKEIVDWVIEYNIEILNVAGNRESTSPGIGLFVYNYLTEVFKILEPI